MQTRLSRALVVAVLTLASAPAVWAEPLATFGVFGKQGATLNGTTVVGGLTGSNGNVTAGAFTNLAGVVGGGQLTFNGSAITGPVTFNGGLTGSPFGLSGNLTGPVNSGGNVALAATLNGNLTAAGNVALQFSNVTGNILAGGNVSVAALSAVNGNVTANGSITGTGITGTVTPFAGVPVNPVAYSPTTVPPADVFTAGGADISVATFQSLTLPPGTYGDLTLAGSGTLTLTAGDYYFDTFGTVGPFGFSNLRFDLTNGPINVFVVGDVTLTNAHQQDALIGGVAQTDPTLGRMVFVESSNGNISLGGFAFDTMWGTYFAPNGNVSAATFTNLNGALIAGGFVTTGSGTINSQPSPRLQAGPGAVIPEPASLALWGLGLAGVAAGWRATRRPRPC